MPTTKADSNTNGEATSSTQTNGGVPHQTSPRVPSPIRVIHDDPEFDQIQVQDWDEKAEEIEAATEEEELIRVQ
jgi:hypothetical protein